MELFRKLKRIHTFACLALCAVLLFAGCQSEKSKKAAEDASYRDTFTKEEKSGGKAQFELMENVKVDARLTPSEKYKDGLKKYFMKHFYETKDLKTREDFAKNPTLYGRDLFEVMDMVAGKLGGEFVSQQPKPEIDGVGAILNDTLKMRDGEKADFYATWYSGHESFGFTEQLYNPYMYVNADVVNIDTEYNLENYLLHYEEMDVPFFDEGSKEETGKEWKAFLEELMGRKLCDLWDCIAVTEESVSAVNEAVQADSSISQFVETSELPEEEYCVFRYYYDVDGLPFQSLDLNYKLKGGETCSKLARMASIDSGQLLGVSDDPQLIRVSKDGVVGLHTTNFRMQGKVYKDTAEVVGPDHVLQKLKEYYGRRLLTAPVTVTEISLVYTGYFTDGSEGEIQQAVSPFWVARVYDGTKNNVQFVYDAFTGEAVVEERAAT